MKKITALAVAAALVACSQSGGVGAVSNGQAVFYQKEQCLQNNADYCATVSIVLPQTEIDWLDKALRQKVYALYSADGMPVKSDEDLKQRAQEEVADLAKSLELYAADGSAISGMLHDLNVELVAQRGNLAAFKAESRSYTGGAHDNFGYSYFVADLEKQKILDVQDIVQDGKLTALDGLLQQKYDDFIVENESYGSEQEKRALIRRHKELFSEKADMDNFMLTADGIEFHYSPYQIASFAQGETKLALPYEELADILKPEYMESLKSGK